MTPTDLLNCSANNTQHQSYPPSTAWWTASAWFTCTPTPAQQPGTRLAIKAGWGSSFAQVKRLYCWQMSATVPLEQGCGVAGPTSASASGDNFQNSSKRILADNHESSMWSNYGWITHLSFYQTFKLLFDVVSYINVLSSLRVDKSIYTLQSVLLYKITEQFLPLNPRVELLRVKNKGSTKGNVCRLTEKPHFDQQQHY